MLGQEDLDPSARSANPRAFGNKSVGARFAVISAGVIMNMITGLVFFMIAFTVGVSFPPAIVGPVSPGSPAATAHAVGHENDPRYRGLRIGDRVVSIDGEEPMDYMDVRVAAALGAANWPRELTVLREGEPAPLVYRVTPEYGRDGLLSFEIEQPLTLEVAVLVQESEAYEAGVALGMHAVEADGQRLGSYAEMERVVAAAEGRPVTVVFEAPDGVEALRPREERLAKVLGVSPRELRPRVELEVRAAPPVLAEPGAAPSVAGLVPPVVVATVFPDSPAEAAGLTAGDVVRQVAGVTWPTIDQMQAAVKGAAGGIEMSVLRDGEVVTIGSVEPKGGLLGVGLEWAMGTPLVASRLPGSPAAALGDLPGGFRLVSVAGEAVSDWSDVARVLGDLEASGEEVDVPLRVIPAIGGAGREAESVTLRLPAEEIHKLAAAQWQLSQLAMGVHFEYLREPVVGDGPIDAAVLGLRKTKSFIVQTYAMILRLFQGSVGVDQLHGPVGITAVGQRVAETGWTYLLYFLGILSVNLAVINFLPIPIADGGHAVFLLVEKIKGSPVSAKVQVAAMYVGLVLLGGLFLLVTYNDIVRIVSGPG